MAGVFKPVGFENPSGKKGNVHNTKRNNLINLLGGFSYQKSYRILQLLQKNNDLTIVNKKKAV